MVVEKGSVCNKSFWRGSIFHSCNQCRAGTIDELHLFSARPLQILNGHHDDDDGEMVMLNAMIVLVMRMRRVKMMRMVILLSSQFCAIQLCWTLGEKIECAGLSKLVF